MAEDWRLTTTLHLNRAPHVLEWLRDHEAEADTRQRLGDAVAVSGAGDTVFAYADTREALTAAEQVLRVLLAEHGIGADFAVHRWHELEERWEDESVPLPQTDAERRAEHERLEAADEADSEQTGRALWEVRLELPSHHETRALAHRLEGEGFSVVARWTYLLVGAGSEDDARELAERLRREAPSGATVQVEPSGEVVAEVMPANPFAIFGGLGT